MSASRIHPNVWKGTERSGGFLYKNTRPTSASSPHFKGRVYLAGVGWYWLSGWWKEDGKIMRASLQEMTDAQATQYCAPKPLNGAEPGPRARNMEDKPREPGTEEIPF